MKWERIALRCRNHAHKLRQALAGALELHRSGRWGRADVEAAGLRDYARIAGHPIAPKTFWRLFDRVIARDSGRNDFTRLELYLPGAIVSRAKPSAFDKAAADLPDLSAAVLAVGDAVRPTKEELQLIWDAACNEWLRLCDAGGKHAKARKRILAALDASGINIAKTYAALRRNFVRKINLWEQAGYTIAALRDRRSECSGKRQPLGLSDEDSRILIARGLTGNGLAPAWRGALAAGELSPAVAQRYISNPASKSYVPQRVRNLLGPDIELLQDIHHGPRQAALKGAYISRDWSDVAPADWYSADDTTLPVYYWEESENGSPRVLRGQCLVMNDCRTNRVLAFALHSERNYTAKVIRGLIVRTHDSFGFPREGFFFERGTWASSKLLKGAMDEVPSEETELGLREFGLRFRHAKPGNARAKTIERILGLLQDRMEGEPGYCGRNEQVEKFERFERLKLDVQSGKLHPQGRLFHRDEWVARLADICDAYNNEPQEGRMLKGMSPREAWDSLFDVKRPLVRLSAETRYLLANHRRPLKVTANGICVQMGKERHWFRNEVTGRLRGRTVQVYFDPEDLKSVFMKMNASDKSGFVIPAEPPSPAMGSTREQKAAANASVAAHNRPARTLYQEIAPHFPKNGPSQFRQVVADPDTVALGEEIAADRAAIRADQEAAGNKARQLSKFRRRFGTTTTQDTVAPEQQAAAYQLIEETKSDAD
jgi:hypothetical protein